MGAAAAGRGRRGGGRAGDAGGAGARLGLLLCALAAGAAAAAGAAGAGAGEGEGPGFCKAFRGAGDCTGEAEALAEEHFRGALADRERRGWELSPECRAKLQSFLCSQCRGPAADTSGLQNSAWSFCRAQCTGALPAPCDSAGPPRRPPPPRRPAAPSPPWIARGGSQERLPGTLPPPPPPSPHDPPCLAQKSGGLTRRHGRERRPVHPVPHVRAGVVEDVPALLLALRLSGWRTRRAPRPPAVL